MKLLSVHQVDPLSLSLCPLLDLSCCSVLSVRMYTFRPIVRLGPFTNYIFHYPLAPQYPQIVYPLYVLRPSPNVEDKVDGC